MGSTIGPSAGDRPLQSPRKVRSGHPRPRDGRATTDALPRRSGRHADQNSSEEHPVAIDTLLVVVGVYGSVDDARADYELVGDLHTEAGLIDAYDAAVIERTDRGKTRIVKKHETPTRVGGVLGGGMGLATGLVVALFPFAAVGG